MSLASMLKVMVVDDHVTSRMLTVEALQSFGITNVGVAKDGREAFTKLVNNPVHLTVSDLYMPDVNGLQLLKAVRAHPKIGKSGFIILTGKKDNAVVNQAAQLGANFVLAKPINGELLKRSIEAVVGKLD
ncbi:MAG: hypothetical protein COB78_03435 [Hyphomicrobiales bacterium]|nr:MAG: hypothetical protein COB78_03435 [Hyphomicrobiales bacterium]